MSVRKKVNLLEYFANSINCFMRGGTLAPEYQLKNMNGTYPDKIIFAKYSKAADTCFFYYDKKIGVSPDGITPVFYGGYAYPHPFLIEDYVDGEMKAIVIAGGLAAVYNGDGFDDIDIPVTLDCGLMHRGRLIGARGRVVEWSGPEGFMDWEEGICGCGKLKLDPAHGDVLNILEYDGKVIAVREYGLTVLSMEGSPEGFNVKPLDTDCDRIYQNTVQVVGGKLYFFTLTGLKCFDGLKISPLKTRHAVSEPWNSAEFGGRYFLACKSDYLKRDAILCVDSSDGESCLLDSRADVFLVKDSVSFYLPNKMRRLVKGGFFVFETLPVSFGSSRLKTLSKIEFDDLLPVYVNNGRYTRYLEDRHYAYRPRMRGFTFTFRLEWVGPIRWATATAEVCDDI